MTELNQNADIRAGDAHVLRFKIDTDEALTGAVAYWWMARTPDPAPEQVIVKKKTGGAGVSLAQNDGAWFMDVDLATGDTAGLSGVFHYEARIILATGEPATVALGRLSIGRTFTPTTP